TQQLLTAPFADGGWASLETSRPSLMFKIQNVPTELGRPVTFINPVEGVDSRLPLPPVTGG
ncbi:MAG: hypothetical protein ACK4IT_05825, partial [Thioalkalivibrionaceae bacterium]